ncbi:regulatory protein RecX [Kordiimonas aestuarii]|uniref:regulatory protein RecX n=1 Tax=Kordiimonas aestuarii TaxID=1005925 RepID=UPI0021D1A807|nr:RecX family transcriptional regulator [Kordiimonas aestuarii]
MKKQGKSYKPKKVSAGYLERAALHYLGRFASSEENLRRVLERKVRRRNEENAPPTDEQVGWIDDVVKKCAGYGYVNDESYARQRAEGLLRKGKPTRQIMQDLRYKGVEQEVAETTVNNLVDEERDAKADELAAAAYVRRRRFGPYRRQGHDIEGRREKEIASMMRAGFSYGLTTRTLDSSQDELEALQP